MARLLSCGAEIGGTVVTGNTPDATSKSGTVTGDTTLFRSGLVSYKCDSTGSNVAANVIQQDANSSGAKYIRGYFNFTALPSSTVGVLWFGAAGSNTIEARITSAGKLELFISNAQQGSDSVATIATGTWYRIELFSNAVNGATSAELQLDGVSVATWSGGALTSSGVSWGFGWETAPGASKVVNVDDCAANDTSGAANTSWCGSGKVVLLKPTADSAVGTGWTDSGGSSTGLFGSVDNTPPTGIADTTANAGHQIRNASSAAASYDATMAAYTTAVASGGGGMSTGDTVNNINVWCATGAPVVTGAKTGSIGVVSNPTVANIAFPSSANFWSGVTAGTYLTGWKWEHGTSTDAPTVTLATQPVTRVTVTGGTASRIAMCCAMLIYVDYTPAVVAVSAPIVNMGTYTPA